MKFFLTLCLVCVCIGAVCVPAHTLATATVHNSVSVSADGGDASLDVTTTINGEVVESFSETSSNKPIEYRKTTVTTNQSVATTQIVATAHERTALLAQLRALLLAYVLRFQ